MEAIDDVNFSERLAGTVAKPRPGLFVRHRVRARIARFEARKRAKETARHTHVRGLEPDVVVEIRAPGVPPLTFAIRQPADGKQVRGGKQAHPISEAQTNAGL